MHLTSIGPLQEMYHPLLAQPRPQMARPHFKLSVSRRRVQHSAQQSNLPRQDQRPRTWTLSSLGWIPRTSTPSHSSLATQEKPQVRKTINTIFTSARRPTSERNLHNPSKEPAPSCFYSSRGCGLMAMTFPASNLSTSWIPTFPPGFSGPSLPMRSLLRCEFDSRRLQFLFKVLFVDHFLTPLSVAFW